jgi:hypothetical protein
MKTADQKYGVYIRANDIDIWRLCRVSSLEETVHEEEFNAQFGLQTLVVGPLKKFPLFVET